MRVDDVIAQQDAAAGELLRAAVDAVERFERLGEGEAFAEAEHNARAAVEALRQRARAALFPATMDAAYAATLLDFQLLMGSYTTRVSGRNLQDLHRIAYPDLAAVIRGPRGTRMLMAGEEVEQFESAIARQLHESGAIAPWAELLAVVVPELAGRIQVLVDARRAAAAAAVERLRAETAAVDAEIARQRQAHREQLAARCSGLLVILPYGSALDPVHGTEVQPVNGAELAKRVLKASDAELVWLESAIVGAEAQREFVAAARGQVAS
jgi:hypothetical protein